MERVWKQKGETMKKTITSILLAVLALSTLTACSQKTVVSYDAEGIVQIAYSEIDTVCDDDALALEGEKIITAMQNSGDLLLSLVVDSSIEITAQELAGYDHLVVTNPEWIDRFSNDADLKPVNYDTIPAGMRDFLTAQMPLWTKDGSVLPDGVGLYEYTGDGLLAFPSNVGETADAISAKNPLIVMIQSPAATMDAKGFLLPLTSSGNLLFTDEEKLTAQLEDSLVSPYVLEVEGVESN